MKLFMNRLIVNIKRCLLSPFMYVMAAVLITLALFCILIPESEKSVYLPVAILNNDDNEKTEEIVEELCDMRSVFEFYEVDSEEEMLDDLAQGKANTGFVIPEDFLERSTGTKKPHEIAVITTPTSGLTSLATEEVFERFFRYNALLILENTLEDYGYNEGGIDNAGIEDIYNGFIEGDGIYVLTGLQGEEYNEMTKSEKIEIPLYKFAGLFIYAACLLGLLSFLTDVDNRIYLRFGKVQRIYMALIQIAIYALPISALSMVCFLAAGIEFSLAKVVLYTLAVIALALAIGVIIILLPIKVSPAKVLSAVLPVYLILCFLFGGILFDLASFSKFLKDVCMIFPPHYF